MVPVVSSRLVRKILRCPSKWGISSFCCPHACLFCLLGRGSVYIVLNRAHWQVSKKQKWQEKLRRHWKPLPTSTPSQRDWVPASNEQEHQVQKSGTGTRHRSSKKAPKMPAWTIPCRNVRCHKIVGCGVWCHLGVYVLGHHDTMSF